MAELPLSFVANNHPTEGGEVGVLLPSSPLREPMTAMLTPDPYLLSGFTSTVTAPHRHFSHPENYSSQPTPPPPTTPLRFIFSGYSLWLELKQRNNDLSRMVNDAAATFSTVPIPMPHVTALYGINLQEGEVRRIFREDVRRVLEEKAIERRRNNNVAGNGVKCLWPDLEASGILVDVEYDGVDNGTMDMAWAEVSFSTPPEHEMLIDALYNLFYSKSNNDGMDASPRSLPWAPHLSLCYDNPEGFPHNLSRNTIKNFIFEKAPTLEGAIDDNGGGGKVDFSREVCGISLWSTAGTMSQWKCLDRIDF